MNIIIYIFIFISKIIENAIATLRLIVVANGKKLVGSLLNLVISLIWVISTGLVVVNIKEDPLKIIFFALGSFIGSYIGSLMEEKIAMGSNMLLVITSKANEIKLKLTELEYNSYILKESDHDILLVMVERKKRSEVLKIMKNIDKKIIIISQTSRQLALDKVMI